MLTEVAGKWSNSPETLTYQWLRCEAKTCTNITAATKNTYTPVAEDVGKTLEVQETAVNKGGSATATSAVTATVLIEAPVNSVVPTITGSATAQQLSLIHI